MSHRVSHDFSRLATLEHVLDAPGVFDAQTEIGRASVTIGAGNAAVRVAAASLGSWGNSWVFTVGTLGHGINQGELDGRVLRVRPSLTGTAVQVAAGVNTALPTGLQSPSQVDRQNLRNQWRDPLAVFGADNAGNPGTDPATPGSASLTGGLDSLRVGFGCHRYGSNVAAGLFVFDADEPLRLVQFLARLDASVAWSLLLRPLTPARAVDGPGVVIASGVSSTVLVDRAVIVPPGWGLGFEAPTGGTASATVQRPAAVP